MLGKIEGKRKRGQQRTRQFDGIPDSRDLSLGKLREIVKDREAWRAVVHGAAKRQDYATEQHNTGVRPKPGSKTGPSGVPDTSLFTLLLLPSCFLSSYFFFLFKISPYIVCTKEGRCQPGC